MIKFSPTVRISLALVLMTISFVFSADMLGILPDGTEATLNARKKICESMAVQFSMAAQGNDIPFISKSLSKIVDRNDDILSAALRAANGEILAEAGDHTSHWTGAPEKTSTPTHIRVPILQGPERWGTVEVSFIPLHPNSFLGVEISSFFKLILFIAVVGFSAFLFFMKRTLRHLDPTSVIPGRVKFALDALAEGVVVIDEKDHIVLANSAFMEKIDKGETSLLGSTLSEVGWSIPEHEEAPKEFPWTMAIAKGERLTGVPLIMTMADGERRTFMVNGAPIQDAKGKCRGALATFDDVTQLEEKNVQLRKTLTMLKKSRDEVRRQNQELNILATQDPLTACLNRRSFFERLQRDYVEAKEDGNELSCIMCDIDHFKSINDTYGHSVGDEIIKIMAEILKAAALTDDYVCRYGGEEFCILLPSSDLDTAYAIAEQIRSNIEAKRYRNDNLTNDVRFTGSFGVTSNKYDAVTPEELIDQADKALYVSKETGRNRVTRWDPKTVLSTLQARKEQSEKEAATKTESENENVVAASEVTKLRKRVRDIQRSYKKRLQDFEREQLCDRVTGLPNRVGFIEEIQLEIARSHRQNDSFAVVLLDVDKLKWVNNTLGRETGDRLLREVGQRIYGVLRANDVVSRFEDHQAGAVISRVCGDEFGLLLTELTVVEDSVHAIKRIIETLSKPFHFNDNELYISVGIGLSVFPQDGLEPETLLSNADIALNTAKSYGPNTYQFFKGEMNETSIHRLQLENHLRHAIENEEFLLYYQPKVDIKTGTITGMEALIRWNYPETGIICPDEFIPVAENSGLITSIGEWVLRTACQQAKQWRDDGFDLSVSVNLSARQFQQNDLIESIIAILEETQLDPHLLELEVTETAIMSDTEAAVATMHMMHNLGIRISIDDFGTGYSSLNHLKRFPIDTVKIDRYFVKDVTTDESDAAIVTAILEMAHKMDLTVVAEGVETEEHLTFLKDLHCEEAQGYLFSRPVPPLEATGLLEAPENMRSPSVTNAKASTTST